MKKFSISADGRFLNKKNCIEEADRILANRHVEGMSRTRLAKEIYFHASVYDFCTRTGRLNWFRARANPIDLNDGGDRLFRRVCYHLYWRLHR